MALVGNPEGGDVPYGAHNIVFWVTKSVFIFEDIDVFDNMIYVLGNLRLILVIRLHVLVTIET